MTLLFILGFVLVGYLSVRSIFTSINKSERFFEYRKEAANVSYKVDEYAYFSKK